jgi:hypothetical protein
MENRTRLVIGFALLAIGLYISVGAWKLALSYPGSSFVFIDFVVPRNLALFPDSFAVYKVPDYLLRYLVLGVFITATSLTIVASSLLKQQLAGFFRDTEMKQFTELMVGFSVLVLGLIISVSVGNALHSFQGVFRQVDHLYPVLGYPFWAPLSYEVIKCPDYLLRYLILGVFITTVGITIVTPSLLKRLAGIEDDVNDLDRPASPFVRE